MLTLTPKQHLASVRQRLNARQNEQSYNDLATIALFYSRFGKTSAEKHEASLLYVETVRQAAEARRMVHDEIA